MHAALEASVRSLPLPPGPAPLLESLARAYLVAVLDGTGRTKASAAGRTATAASHLETAKAALSMGHQRDGGCRGALRAGGPLAMNPAGMEGHLEPPRPLPRRPRGPPPPPPPRSRQP
jgi:hypothetical protein